MNKLFTLLFGAGIGAGLMYYRDPNMGRTRAAKLRDQVNRLGRESQTIIDQGVEDLQNRARGYMYDITGRIGSEPMPENIMSERVRARLGSLTTHPRAVNVDVRDGVAYLTGPVLRDEVDRLVTGISKIRGVSRVENNLEVFDDAANIPSLQGEGYIPGNEMWSPSGRLIGGAGSLYLLTRGTFRGGFSGTLMSLAGLALGVRTMTNKPLAKALGFEKEGSLIRVNKTINVDTPIEEVYGLWSNYDQFPRFMSHVQEVHETGDRSHWVVKGPAGKMVEFDAITTQEEPNNVIAWETIPDSEVIHRGRVRFRENQRGGTTVHVTMEYSPPAGVIGHAVASIFGADPKTAMDEDLARFKTLVEEGKTRSEGKTVTADDVTTEPKRRKNNS